MSCLSRDPYFRESAFRDSSVDTDVHNSLYKTCQNRHLCCMGVQAITNALIKRPNMFFFFKISNFLLLIF